MMYEILFWAGLLGMAAQALLGMGGHGHAHSPGARGHGHQVGQGRNNASSGRSSDLILSLLSPLTLFGIAFGIGAAGLLLRTVPLLSPERFLLAALSGLAFYGILIRPLRSFIFQFASKPAKALEGAVAQTAEALSHFDATGKGLVRLTIDGQLVRVLAYLDRDDQPEAATIQPGDQLIVISVDGRTNSCRVARI